MASDSPILSDTSINSGDFTFTKSVNHASEKWLKSSSSTSLILECGEKQDFFCSPKGKGHVLNSPALLQEIDNTKPFTFSAKVTPKLTGTYDAGVLYLFSNNTFWQKLAFELDERNISRVVTVRTIETSDDNNHEPVDQPHVYFKISSDTNVIGFYFSKDNVTWQMVRIHKNEYPEKVWIGVATQSPLGNGTSVQFEELKFSSSHVTNFRSGV